MPANRGQMGGAGGVSQRGRQDRGRGRNWTGGGGAMTKNQRERLREQQLHGGIKTGPNVSNYNKATGWQGAGGFLKSEETGDIVRSNIQVERENERLAKIAERQAAAQAAVAQNPNLMPGTVAGDVAAQKEIARMDTVREDLLNKAKQNTISNEELNQLAGMNRDIGVNETTGMGLEESLKYQVPRVMADLPNMPSLKALSALTGKVTGGIGNFLGDPRLEIGSSADAYRNLMQQEKIRGGERRALNREGIYGGIDPLSSSAVARDASPLTTPAADPVNPTTGAIDYSNAMATSPALSNQMLSSPATLPTMAAQGTPYKLRDYYAGVLGQDPSIYQTAANGGRIGFGNGGWEADTDVFTYLTPFGQKNYDSLIEQGKSHNDAVGLLERMEGSGSAFLPDQKLAIFNSVSKSPTMTENPSWKRTNERYGGRIGKMSGGMMIMGDNGVVNNGVGGILSKYKEIRSEL